MVEPLSGRPRVIAPQTAVLLGIGDLVALGAFSVMGALSHGPPPLEAPANVVETTIPFAVAWVTVAFAAGLYGPAATGSPRALLRRAIPAWLVAAPVALAIRATPLFEGGVQLSFTLVVFAVPGTLLLGWRLLATVAFEDGVDPAR